MEKDIISQLHSLRDIKPDEHFRATQKEILMNQISSSARTAKGAGFIWFYLKETFIHEMSLLGQPMAGLAAIILLIFGGGIFSISAASEATPGSFLYTVKIVSEKTRFAFALQPEDKMRLNVEFAERRATEIKTLTDNNEGNIDGAAEDLKNKIVSAQEQLKQVEGSDLNKAAELARDMEDKTAGLREKLQATKNALAQSSGAAKNKLNEAIQSVDRAGLSALSTIAKSTGKTSGAGKDELSRKVASKLKLTKDKISELEKDAKVFSAGFSRSEVGLQVYSSAQKVTEEKTKEANKAIVEAEKLLNNNNYQAALNKIAESESLLDEVADANSQTESANSEQKSTSTPEAKTELKPEVKGEIEEATTTEAMH
ncbi:MAG: DUF5667 domain-containing protein [Patescibacteria group bacterium]